MINPTDKDVGRPVVWWGSDPEGGGRFGTLLRLYGDGVVAVQLGEHNLAPGGADGTTVLTHHCDWAD